MARKRGGLAGVWDRNKKIIKPIATVGAGLLGGPAAAAAANAAMEGFDRPGRRGIGLDAKKAAIGAASGYALGQGAQWAQGALGGGSAAAASAGAGAGAGTGATAAKAAGAAGGKMNWGAAAQIGSAAIGALTNSAAQRQQANMDRDRLAMSDRQFEAKYGFDKAQAESDMAMWNRKQENLEQGQALDIQNMLNRAPMMDRAQALLMARLGAAPVAFNPRDVSRGTAELNRKADDPFGGVMRTMSDAATKYRPGDGGMDFDLHRRLLAKLSNPTPTKMANPGTYRAGKGYTPPVPGVAPVAPPAARPPVAVGSGGVAWGDDDEDMPYGRSRRML